MLSWANFLYGGLVVGTFCAGLGMLQVQRKIHKAPRMLLAIGIVAVPFVLWDAWAVSAGHWDFNTRFVTGLFIGNLAFEEIAFFIAIPFAMLAIYEWLPKRTDRGETSRFGISVIVLLSVLFLFANSVWTYTFVVALSSLLALIASWLSTEIFTRHFWTLHIVGLALFLVFNMILTSVPIIEYGAENIIGIRIGTIPLEDVLYNFALLSFSVTSYNRLISIAKK